jgi:hypothetical protein
MGLSPFRCPRSTLYRTRLRVTLFQLTQTAVKEAILELGEQKVLGLDGILPSILRKLVAVVKVWLTLLFNLFLLTGIFPAVWKESFVVSILKSRKKRDIYFVSDTEIFREDDLQWYYYNHPATDFCHAAWFLEGLFHSH